MIEYTSERRCFSIASKGQIFSKYTESKKEEILNQYISGVSGYYLSKIYGIPVGTIKMWKYKIDHPEKNSGLKRGEANKKNLTKEDWKERYEILKKYQAFLKAQRERK